MKKFRKFITTGVGFTFLVVGTTGVIFKLFFVNYTLEEIHGWLGLLLVTVVTLHVLQNWHSLKNHLKDPRVFGFIVPIALVVSYFYFVAKEPVRSGVNPRQVIQALSRASADNLAKALGKDTNSIFAAMKKDGLTIGDSGESIEELAKQNHKLPDGILEYFFKY